MPRLDSPEAVADRPPVRVDLEQLIQCHFSFIWRLLRRLGLPASDADDAAQQVFLIAAAKLDRIHEGRERAFLYGCALHRAAKWQRRSARQRTVSLDSEPPLENVSPALVSQELSAEELLDRAKARTVLDAILSEMPVSLRSIFVLYEIEQLSTQEIAALIGVPRGTVASRLRRAREEFEKRTRRWEARPAAAGGTR